MGAKVIITGSTGMIGKGVLLECLEDDRIEKILLLNRRPVDIESPKIIEHIQKDFHNFSDLRPMLENYDACYYCSGVSSFGKNQREYNEITYKMTLHLAKLLSDINPKMTFIYLSAKGASSEGDSKRMWARIKGKTENAILTLPFKKKYMFRPFYVQAKKGIRPRPALQALTNVLINPIFPLIKWMAPNGPISTIEMGKAMINCHFNDVEGIYLYNKEISLIQKGITHSDFQKSNSASIQINS